MSIYLGFDIGATKTHGMIADHTGKVLAFSKAGPGNHESVGWDGLEAILHQVTDDLLTQVHLSPTRLAGAGFGIAGLDWPTQYQPHIEKIGMLGLDCPITAVNDAVLGIVAGTSEGWGISIISGTGENCWGVDRERNFGHMTGNNGLMGEYGGASTIVLRAIQAAAKQWGKRGPQTLLSEIFIAETGATSLDDLLEGLALGRYFLEAGSVPLVFEAARAGDQAAIETILWAAHELADMIKGVARQLEFYDKPFEVVMIGSTFKGGPLLVEPMQKSVQADFPKVKFIRLEAPPVVGGVLLAMEKTTRINVTIRQNLLETLKKFDNM